MKYILFSLFVLACTIVNGQNQAQRNTLIIDSLDHKRVDKPYDQLSVIISGGEEQKVYNFRFYLNDELIDSVRCTMWGSIGRCICSDESYASIQLKHSAFSTSDSLKIESDDGYVVIGLRKDYKTLHFSTWSGGGKALFIRGWGDRPVILE